MNSTLILIPTYNQEENVKNLYKEIKGLGIKTDILFIDDNSPDQTSKIIKKLASEDTHVKLILITGKNGLGNTHLTGIHWAYKNRYKTLITMNSDFTYMPSDIPKLIKKKDKATVVVGSSYLKKKSMSEWSSFRKTHIIIANFLTQRLLGLKFDTTSAFRLYQLDKIPEKVFTLSESKDYTFLVEILYILFINGYTIAEIPINPPARVSSISRMRISSIWNSFSFLLQTFFLSKTYQDSYIYSPAVVQAKIKREKIEKEWDGYWLSTRKQRKILYDTVAVFYRKYIIRRALNYYLSKTFKHGQSILHAGCGGGQVDSEAVKYLKITALDISSEALNRYKRLYSNLCTIMYGSIFKIPSRQETFDGIYNLGVMEHFSKKDIKKILDEFHRVLRPKGKILLFWPPEFGPSVIFLNSVHFLLNNILKKNIRLHPKVITILKSKQQIYRILAESGFKLTSYKFDIGDLFTYVVITGEKNEASTKKSI